MTRTLPVVPLQFAYALISHAAPAGANTETALQVDSASALPLIVVQATDTSTVSNGPVISAARMTIVCSCYAETREEAASLAQNLFRNVYDVWYTGFVCPYGGFTALLGVTPPEAVASALEADNTYRFDVAFPVIARP